MASPVSRVPLLLASLNTTPVTVPPDKAVVRRPTSAVIAFPPVRVTFVVLLLANPPDGTARRVNVPFAVAVRVNAPVAPEMADTSPASSCPSASASRKTVTPPTAASPVSRVPLLLASLNVTPVTVPPVVAVVSRTPKFTGVVVAPRVLMVTAAGVAEVVSAVPVGVTSRTEYVPGGSPAMEKFPEASVVAEISPASSWLSPSWSRKTVAPGNPTSPPSGTPSWSVSTNTWPLIVDPSANDSIR